MIPRKASSRSLSGLSQPQRTAALRLLARRSRRRTIGRKWCTEPLEIRQLLTGDFVWANTVQSTSGADPFITPVAITHDLSGNVYSVGNFGGVTSTASFDFDPGPGSTILTSNTGIMNPFITKSSPTGSLRWARQLRASSAGIEDVEVDSSGSVWLSGTFSGSLDADPGPDSVILASSGNSGFLIKLDAEGNYLDAFKFGGELGGRVFQLKLEFDSTGAVILAGSFDGMINVDPFNGRASTSAGNKQLPFVCKFFANLDFQWSTTATINDGGYVSSLSVDANGHVSIGGVTQTGFKSAPFLSTFAPNSVDLWTKTTTGSGNGRIHASAKDNLGNMFFVGSFTGNLTFDGVSLSRSGSDTAFAGKCDPSGRIVWIRQFNSTSSSAEDVSINRHGDIIICGTFSGSLDLDPGTETETALNGGGRQVYLTSISSNGDFLWGRTFEGRMNRAVVDISTEGDIYLSASFSGSLDLNPDIGVSPVVANSQSAFTVKLTESVAYTDPGGSDLVLRRNGKYLELFRRHIAFGDTLLERHYLASKPAIDILGSNTVSNSLIIDFASGGTFTTAGIRFNGGTDTTNNDRVTIVGANFEGATYRPSGGGFSEFRIHNQSISMFQSESAFASGLFSLNMETAAGADVLTMSPATGYQSVPATRITGTTAGQTLIPLTFSNVPMTILDTGLNDLTLAASHDSVTVAAGGLEATGLLSLIVRTGKGNDTLKVNGPDIGLPGTNGTAGGTFTFLAGSGTDRIAAAGDTNWQVSDNRLRSSGGGSITLDDIEKATLTGGDAANTLTATGFTGDLTADGGAGNDLIRGNSGNDYLLGGTGNDRIYGADGDDQLMGQDGNDSLYGNADEDVLKGGAGNDRLFGGDDDDRVLGELGDDTLFGGSGNDSLDGSEGNDLLNGESGNDNLIGGVGRDLYELNGTSNAEDLRLLRSSATIAAFQRKPRGLSSILERDTITMDASDEFVLYALGGDDLIAIDSLFTQLGFVDGGDGTDTCTSPTAWSKVSC
jgi:hypothetical protein